MSMKNQKLLKILPQSLLKTLFIALHLSESLDVNEKSETSENTSPESAEDIVHSTSSVSPSDIESENHEESSDQSETSEDNSHGSSYGSSSKTDESSKSEKSDNTLKETSDDIIHSTSSVSPLEFKSRGMHFSDISKVGGVTINTKKGGRWHTDRIKNQGNSKSFGIGLKNSVLNDIRQQMRKNLKQKHFTSNIIMNNKPRGKFSRSWSTNWSSGSKGGGPKSYSRSWSTNWSSGSRGEGSKSGLNNFQLNLKVGSKGEGSKSGLN